MNKQKHIWVTALAFLFVSTTFTGCHLKGATFFQNTGRNPVSVNLSDIPSTLDDASIESEAAGSVLLEGNSGSQEEIFSSAIDKEEALSIALANAGVPEEDAYHVKIERDGDHDIPIYDIVFETDYGDYDFEVSISGGQIVGADYEVDEQWLDALGGKAVTLEEARAIIQAKVPGASPDMIQIWEEHGDGRGRYEGELSYNNMKYEFEMDPKTGIIFDWNADLRD